MGKGDRVISRLLQRGFALIAAFGVSLALAGVAAGQVATDEAPGGREDGQGEASPPSEGETPPSDGQEEDETDGQGARADLSISLPDAEKDAEINRELRYKFRVVNRGPGTATDVRALLNPPLTFSTDGAPDGCRYSKVYESYECKVDELRPGEDAVLTVRGEFDELGFASHTASVRSETADPDPANNLALQRVEIGDDPEDDGKVTSEFEDGIDGWTASGDPAAKPKWVSSDGFARVVDGVRGDTLYQEAPAKFEGDKAAYYGGELSFDLRQSDRDLQFEEDDVILEGAGTTLVYDMKDEPGTRWTDFTAKLEEGEWKVSPSGKGATEKGKRATEEQIREVLADLDRLAIRAEHRNGADTDDLDNVLLEAGEDEAAEGDDEGSDDEGSEGDDKQSDGDDEPSDESSGSPVPTPALPDSAR